MNNSWVSTSLMPLIYTHKNNSTVNMGPLRVIVSDLHFFYKSV